MKKIIIACLFLFCLNVDALPIDAQILQAMEEWKVPGCAIAVIKDGKVVHASGYGVRKTGSKDAVDTRTLFAIGSCTKAFTATAIAMLVDEKKISWDDRVIKYLPQFPLSEITLRDLLCHRSGFESHELIWYGTSLSRDEILLRLKYVSPTYTPRSRLCYNNLMYLVAGQIIPQVTHKSWDDFLRDRIFIPLSMFETSTSLKSLEVFSNVASPHALINGELKVIPWRNIDPIGPAGSINSNLLEMIQWVQFQLASGKIKKKTLLSSTLFEEMQSPQITLDNPTTWQRLYMPRGDTLSYGLGWWISNDRGLKVVEHLGAVDGMSSLVTMIPEKDLGIILLTNCEKTYLLFSLKQTLFDILLEDTQEDWNGYYKRVKQKIKEEDETKFHQLVNARLGHGILRYPEPISFVGIYESPIYGSLSCTLNQDGNKLLFKFASFEGELSHLQAETYELQCQQFPLNQYKCYIIFTQTVDGKKVATFFSPGFIDAPFILKG